MRGVSKKMLISILTSVIVFVTMVATTFAWVGIFTYANTDNFNINLKVQDLDVNYFLTISATGEKNSFSDEADLIEIERQILKNNNVYTDDVLNKLSNSEIEKIYSRNSNTTPSSYIINSNNQLEFYSINNKMTSYYETYNPKNGFLKFDIYLSVNTKEGIQEETEINSNVFITDIAETIQGTISKQRLTNLNPFKKLPSLPNEYNSLLSLPDSEFFEINSANACRFALCIFNPIDVNSSYKPDDYPTKTLIYHGGKQMPNVYENVYDLGGNLPEDYNTALQELLIIRPNYKNSVYPMRNQKYRDDLEYAINMGGNELDLIEDNTKIWTKPSDIESKPYLGVHDTIQTKMKIEVYFWFEGWDADCIFGINEKPVTLNLNFTAGIDD